MSIHWINITSPDQIEQIKERSKVVPQIIFKHSTRCGTSSVVKHRLEKHTPPEFLEFNFLDLIRHRAISNKIAEDFKVYHESPQVLLIKNGECLYEENHIGIRMEDIVELARTL